MAIWQESYCKNSAESFVELLRDKSGSLLFRKNQKRIWNKCVHFYWDWNIKRWFDYPSARADAGLWDSELEGMKRLIQKTFCYSKITFGLRKVNENDSRMVSHACAKTVSDKTAASETNPKNTPNDLRNEKQKLKLFPSNNNRILHCDLCENTKLDGCDWKIKLPKRREDFGDCQRDFGTDFVWNWFDHATSSFAGRKRHVWKDFLSSEL